MKISIVSFERLCYNNQAFNRRPVGQAAKTSPSHGENMGSIPVRVTKTKNICYTSQAVAEMRENMAE